MTKLIN